MALHAHDGRGQEIVRAAKRAGIIIIRGAGAGPAGRRWVWRGMRMRCPAGVGWRLVCAAASVVTAGTVAVPAEATVVEGLLVGSMAARRRRVGF